MGGLGPYAPGVPAGPDHDEYTFSGGAHDLVLFRDRPGEDTRRGVASGPARIGFVAHGPVIVVLSSFDGGETYGRAPFSWHRLPEGERALPPPLAADARALIRVTLVDTATGWLVATRVGSLAPIVSRSLESAIASQAVDPWDPEGFRRTLDDLERRYPTGRALSLGRLAGGMSTLEG